MALLRMDPDQVQNVLDALGYCRLTPDPPVPEHNDKEKGRLCETRTDKVAEDDGLHDWAKGRINIATGDLPCPPDWVLSFPPWSGPCGEVDGMYDYSCPKWDWCEPAQFARLTHYYFQFAFLTIELAAYLSGHATAPIGGEVSLDEP